MPDNLLNESKFFRQKVKEWRNTHMGKFVLIKGHDLIGFYQSLDDAFNTGIKNFGVSDFLVEQILPAEEVHVSFFGQG